jgi:exopolysaccharide biosynthesis protein
MEQNGRCRMGPLEEPKAHGAGVQKPKWAVSGFRGILKNGEVLVAPSGVLHPRTAVGLSADAKWMTWIVVDGRQPGYSLGVSEEELARLLKENGCADGINLDGGGSSVLLLADRSRRLKPANQPSDHGRPRPVPVILGVTESTRR